MEVLEISDKKIWDHFVIAQPYYSFFQSWNWGEFNKAIGNKIWRLGLYDNNQLKGVALLIKTQTKLRRSLFVPHGPILKTFEPKEKMMVFNSFVENLKIIAKEEKVDFIRITPSFRDNEEEKKLFGKLGFISSPMPMFTEKSWYLDISLPEEELLRNMRKTTRYLVRKSWKDGVSVTKNISKEYLKYFYILYRESALRHNFTPYSYQYLKLQIEKFALDDQITIFIGWLKQEPIAGVIVVFYGKTAFYHHGASSIKYSKVPGTYAVLWEAIKTAKRRGCKFYNFLAIAPKNRPRHPFSGITLFKTGFGGFPIKYLHTQDFPITFRYWLRYIFETIRRKLKRL